METGKFMNRLPVLLSGLAAFLVLVCMGCQKQPLNKEAMVGLARDRYPAAPRGLAPSLRILVWPDSILPQIAQDFNRRYGVKLEIDTFDNDEEAYRKTSNNPSQWGLIMVSQYMGNRLRKEHMLLLVPKANDYIYRYIDASLINPQADPQMHYFIPFDYATMGITFNVDYMAGFPRKWEYLSNQQQNSYVYGRIVMNDDMRYAMSVAMLYVGRDPAHPTSQDIQDARDLLIRSVKEFGLRFLPDAKIRSEMERGTALMGITWSGEASAILKARPACRFLIPEGKAIVTIDGFCIPKGAPSPVTSALFIEYMLHPYVSLLTANSTMYSSVNTRSMRYAERFVASGPSTMLPLPQDRVHMKHLDADELKLWEDAWAEVLRTELDTNRISLVPLE